MAETLANIMRSRSAMSAELKDVSSYFQVALEHMARGLSMFDERQRLIVCNRLYGEIYDIPEHLTRPGTSLEKIIRFYMSRERGTESDSDVAGQLEWIRKEVAILAQGKLRTRTQVLFNGRSVRVSTQPLPRGGWVDIIEDISEEAAHEAELTRLAYTDSLTDLPNRLKFQSSMEDLSTKIVDEDCDVTIVAIGAFQAIREQSGLAVRDAMLREIGKSLRASVSSGDILARLDGDIFAIVHDRAAEEGAVADRQARLVALRDVRYNIYGHEIDAGLEIKTLRAPRDPRELDQALSYASRSSRAA